MRFLTTALGASVLIAAALTACKARQDGSQLRDADAAVDVNALLSELADGIEADLNILYAGTLPARTDALALDDAPRRYTPEQLAKMKADAIEATKLLKAAVASTDEAAKRDKEARDRLTKRLEDLTAALIRIDPEETDRYAQGLNDIRRVLDELARINKGAAVAVTNCPTGYVSVPGDPVFQTQDVCVMKYEAKDGNGQPKVNVSWNDAKAQCQSLGQGHHLITNHEWMTVATNIAGQGANWSNASVGGGKLNRGNSNSSAASAATGDDNSSWTINRRTHKLSSGEVIWDLAGNVWEWVDYFNRDDKILAQDDWKEISVFSSGTSTMPLTELRPTSSSHSFWQDSWNSERNTGKYYSYKNGSGGALLRGGNWADDSFAGVFAATLLLEPSSAYRIVGFRCAFSNAE